METEKKGYEVKQNGKDYIVLIDLEDNKLIIKCLNTSTNDYFSSKNYILNDLHTMNKYFRIADNIKEIQTLLNTAIEKVKIGLLEDFNQMTIFFYLMLGVDENTIAIPLIKENQFTKKSIISELRNDRLNPNYLETLESVVEKIEGENYEIKKETNMLKEEIKKLYMESNELKKESMQLKEDNDSLREQNKKLLEFKKKYESSMSTPFKSDSEFQGEMQISTVIDEMIKGNSDYKKEINQYIKKNEYEINFQNYEIKEDSEGERGGQNNFNINISGNLPKNNQFFDLNVQKHIEENKNNYENKKI